MNIKIEKDPKSAIETVEKKISEIFTKKVHTEKWQGMEISKKPEFETYELFNHSFSFPMEDWSMASLARKTGCSFPWAENHFLERVSGKPLNPGNEWENWPYSKSADTHRNSLGQFTHTYMERYWPRKANGEYTFSAGTNHGVRFEYGDLDSVVSLLSDQPQTRQAYLPVWFPEDTGVLHGGRVPCTLGYHFLMRDGYLHINYYIRSCDVIRHFRDDVYLTVRLAQWVLERLKAKSESWQDVSLGFYTQHTTSFHCFVNDYQILRRKHHVRNTDL